MLFGSTCVVLPHTSPHVSPLHCGRHNSRLLCAALCSRLIDVVSSVIDTCVDRRENQYRTLKAACRRPEDLQQGLSDKIVVVSQ